MNVDLIAPPDKEKPGSAAKKPWFWYWVPTAVFLIGIFSIVLLLWANRINADARRDDLITAALMDAQINAATGHLWLEEAVSGDDTADQALAEIDQAITLINIVLNGGETEHGLIAEALLDPELRGHAETLRSMLVTFKKLAQERLQDITKAGIASDLDQQFDAAFKELLGKARGLEEIITKNEAEEQVKAGRLFLCILSAWIFIVIATTAGLWSREVRRKSAEEALLKAHAQLLAQTAELTEHREHLTGLVEIRTAELTRANELLRGEIDERKRMEGEVLKLNNALELKVEERTRQLFEIQEELVRGEKLAILGQLSGSVGHELRNPLGVMSNAVYFLKMVLTDADATVREYLEIIKKEIDTSLQIITDLLDFTRTKPPQRVVISAEEVVRQSLERCTVPENVAVTVALPDGLPRLKVDPLQMGQILTNIITNGVQAMPDGGALWVAARFVGAPPCGCPEAGGHEEPPLQDFIAISVTDTGEGIAPENMIKLFQPLFTTKARGIGLGLVVCKNLVTANSGRIEVESEPGKGTTFSVFLPIERGEP
jgi:signal transduction histidine kinase